MNQLGSKPLYFSFSFFMFSQGLDFETVFFSSFLTLPFKSIILFERLRRTTELNRKMLLKFQNFAIPESIKGHNYVPFREIIRLFIKELTEVKQEISGDIKIWSASVTSEPDGVVFPFHVVEESILQSSVDPFCDHCKYAGWGHHYVSKRRYHLIIPEKDQWYKNLKLEFSELRTHILYGLIHCNGYGHLICVNGFKVDSNIFCESDLMDFWDRICSSLNTRKISVCDSLEEGSIKLRLLHVVAFRKCWFGKWGYKFNRGSYGVTEQKYGIAVTDLCLLGLEEIINYFRNKVAGKHIEKIINKYKELSDISLITLSDLFKFMLGFKCRGSTPTPSNRKEAVIQGSSTEALGKTIPVKFDLLATSLAKSCRWPQRRIKQVLMVVVNFMKEKQANGNGKRGISRQDLREEVRKSVGDTGLIDFVLKSITCFAMGNHIVRRSINSRTRKYEFKLEEIAKRTKTKRFLLTSFTPDYRWDEKTARRRMSLEELQEKDREPSADNGVVDLLFNLMTKTAKTAHGDEIIRSSRMTYETDVYEDILFLYRNVLFGYEETESVSLASRIVVDSKQFVKEWLSEDQEMNPLMMALTCQFFPSFEELETELTRPLSPGEVVVVPASITINELKRVAESAFRDVYCMMEKFVVTQIGGIRAIEEDRLLCYTVEPNGHVYIKGIGLDLDTELRYEGGVFELAVECICGAKSDDGERMRECDICHVWQHTGCNGIDDDEGTPPAFICSSCRHDEFGDRCMIFRK